MTICLEDFFDQFRNKNLRDSNLIRSKRNDVTNTPYLPSFGNDIYNCNENFMEQNIDYKHLASLSRKDLELLGVSDPETQLELLDAFKDLARNDYTLDEIFKSNDGQDFNRQMLKCAASHFKSMKMALAAADCKLEITPSGDVMIEDKNSFASKFVLNVLEEFRQKIEEIDEHLAKLEKVLENKRSSVKKISKISTVILAAMTIGLYFLKTKYLK